MRSHRIALLGTFDLQNYGDLLFPLLTRHELGRRLGDVEVLPFSYLPKDEPDWPYRVFPIEEFPDRLGGIDAVVVGGGHVARFDREVAPGYGPASPDVHHPTGLWLLPAFLATAAGRPVAWNSVGVSPEVGPWATEILAAVLEASAYLAVRDPASRVAVRTAAPGADCTLSPDSAFGVRALLDGEAERGFREWRRAHGLEGPYVVVQGTDLLQPVAEDLRRELRALAAEGLAVVELPIGPVLGDRTGSVAPDWSDLLRVDPWPPPLLLAQIVGHAEGAIGHSLHLGITSLCHGVPLHRPRTWAGQKYQILDEFPGVHQFNEHGGEPRISLAGRIGRRDPCPQVVDRRQRLVRHWDRIAEAVDRRPAAGPAARLSSRLSRSLIRSLNALAHASDALEESRQESLRQGELLEEAERSRRRGEQELVELRRSAEEQRATNEELRSCLEGLRRLTGEERGRLERELEDSEHARVELQGVLDAIHRSRAWRLCGALWRISSAVAAPRRRRREAPLREPGGESGAPRPVSRDSPEP